MNESFAAALLVLLSVGSTAYAQPSSAPPQLMRSAAGVAGPFQDLSPGSQQIARVIFEAQSASRPKRFTLNQIAIRRLSGQGWGRIVQDMRARGLVADKNLSELALASEHFGPEGFGPR
jgi:hypothetical protein